MTEFEAHTLPALRQELELIPGASNPSGASQWLIYDPLRHKYFAVETDAATLLGLWAETSEDAFIAKASARLCRPVTRDEVAELIYFLYSNTLTEQAPDGNARSYADQARAAHRSLLSQAVHSYLFVRIPLVRPNRLLQATLPFVLPFFARATWIMISLFGILGVYLVSRQWDVFVATFLDFISLDGLMAYGLALVLIKVLHELGHAYAATYHGVRVTSMGVAFMVMMPLLYTDVTNAWRLRSHAKRMQIDGAGIMVELGLACLATCLWIFLPDGPLRSAAFVTATSSWIISLAVNLNPFMKFDGYYLLSDGLGIPNIHTRAFALARWHLREVLFKLGHPQPDTFQPATARALVFYAWGIWIYRLILFIGIALLVYHLFFKLLGVILFAIEIVWFIALPIGKEIRVWWALRSEIMTRKRTLVSVAILASCVALLVVPMRWPVVLPGIIESSNEVAIHVPRAAQVTSWKIQESQRVASGQILAVLRAPELTHELNQTSHTIALLDLRLARIAGDSADLLHRSTILQERRARLEEYAGYKRQIDSLVVKAPFAGALRDVDTDLHAGAWVGKPQRLTRLVQMDRPSVRAYASEDVLWKLAVGSVGVFIPDDPQLGAIQVRLNETSQTGVEQLDIRYIASVHGGPISSERDGDGKIRPRKSQYLLRLSLTGDAPKMRRVLRGVVHLPGRAESLGSAIWTQVFRVFIREAGL